jgi:hypothetical protein
LRWDSDYEVVGEQGPQQQGNAWQQKVAKLFKWVPQFPEIPWRTSKKTQHNERSVSSPSHFVTRSELSNSKDKSCVRRSELSSCEDESCVTRSELSSCKDKLCMTKSEMLNHHDKDDLTNCDSSSRIQGNSCLRTNIQDVMKRRTDGDRSGQEEVSTIRSHMGCNYI